MDPNNQRPFFLFYAVLAFFGVVFLYRYFIFSHAMLGGGDMLTTGIFFRSFLVDHVWQHGSIPLWNPYMFCGLPYVDAFHGDIFYPLSFLKYFGTIWRMIGFTLILHVFLAAIFMYLAARQLGLSKLAAATAGLAYAFSGWLNGLTVPGHDGKMFVTALFPLTIFFLDRAFAKDRFLNFTMLGVVIGLIILTPHPQLAYYSLLALCAYTIYKLIALFVETRHIGQLVAPGLLAVYAVALGLLISSVQLLPGYLYLNRWSVRSEQHQQYKFSTTFSLHQEEAISMLVPEFAGRDRIWDGFRSYWGQNSFKDNSEYVGLVAMMLAFVGMFYGRNRHRLFIIPMAVFTFLYALGDHTPFFKWCYYTVPLLKSTRAPSTIVFLFSFAVSILAGMGIDALLRRLKEERDFRFRLPLQIMVYGLPGLLLAGAVAYTYAPDEAHQLYLTLISPQLLGNEGKLAYAVNNFPAMASGFWIAFGFSVAVVLCLKLSRYRGIGIIAISILPLLVMADGIRYNAGHIRLVDAEKEFTASPLIRYIRENAGNYRFCGNGLIELDMQPYYHGLQSTIGYHGNQLATYIDVLRDRDPYCGNYIRPRFADLAGVKYIICPVGNNFDSLGYDAGRIREAARDGGRMVVENPGCFPRTYLAGRYRLFPSVDSLAYSLYDSKDDLRRTVYLTQSPDGVIDSVFTPDDTAYIDHYGIDSIDIYARCGTGKILTLSDNYFHDWHVFVDGKETKPLVTYGTFRGVVLEPGEHRVVWRYVASNYRIGKTLTAVAFLYVLAFMGAMGFRRRFSRRR